MKVFADTSGLFAVLVRNDFMHVRARATFETLLQRGAWLVTTSYVMLETVALLHARVGPDAARRFHHDFPAILHLHWVDAGLHERAFRRLELRRRRDISLVDCASFVLMEEAGIHQAFGYDKHFAGEGFTLLGTPRDVDPALPRPNPGL